MKKYTVQRPLTVWVETVVRAGSPDHALDLADENFRAGEYTELHGTFDINYDKHWLQNEDGEVSYL